MLTTDQRKLLISASVITGVIILWLILFVLPLKSHADVSLKQYCSPQILLTPTPTPLPISEQAAGNGGSGVQPSNPSTNTTGTPGSATCNVAFKGAILQGFDRISPTCVSFAWWKSTDSVDSYALLYGYSPTHLAYGVTNLSNTSSGLKVCGLNPNQSVWGQVVAFKNGCGQGSQIVDP